MIGDAEGLGGFVLGEQEADVVVIKAAGIGEKGELDIFVLNRRAGGFEGCETGAVRGFRLCFLALVGVEISEFVLGFPLERWTDLWIAGDLGKDLFRLLSVSRLSDALCFR